MDKNDLATFRDFSFDDYRQRATDHSLSQHQKIGFPNSHREGYAESILRDIRRKLPGLDGSGRIVLDIGPGCGEVAQRLIDHCRERRHQLLLVDSAEMLSQLPDEPFTTKIAARFPNDCHDLLTEFAGRVDTILSYSVLQVVCVDGNPFDFVDSSLELLTDGGEMLLGDVPNVSQRKRFFSSARGIRFHQEFMRTSDIPVVTFNQVERGRIDDAVIASIVMRCRAAGFDAYWLPQASDLPMANRREDILIRKP